MKTPLVSVIIPSYNRARTIKKSIQSVLNQTLSDFELIVVDDCSTDNTRQIVESINDSRIIYLCQPENKGACAARNKGIEIAKGHYIAFHDSDDIWHKDKLEKQLKCFEFGADLVFCQMKGIVNGKDNGIISRNFKSGFQEKRVTVFDIGTQTIIARRNVLEDIKFDEKVPRLQDFDLLMRIRQKYRIYFLAEPLVDYYLQNDSISKNPTKFYTSCKIFKEKYPDMDAPTREVLACGLFQTAVDEMTGTYRKYKTEALKLSMWYTTSIRLKIKCLMQLMNVYKFFRIIKSSLRALHSQQKI